MEYIHDAVQDTAEAPVSKTKRLPLWIIYLLPSMLIFLIFTFYPFVKTLVTSFFATTNTGALTQFVDIQNYISLFTDPKYLQNLGNTLLYLVLTVPLTVIISLMLAVLSCSNLPGMGVFRTIFSSTMGISVAAGSVFWNLLFHPTAGLLNHLISSLGGRPVGWLTDANCALLSVSAVSIWMNIGFSYLVLMGGLKNIDRSRST